MCFQYFWHLQTMYIWYDFWVSACRRFFAKVPESERCKTYYTTWRYFILKLYLISVAARREKVTVIIWNAICMAAAIRWMTLLYCVIQCFCLFGFKNVFPGNYTFPCATQRSRTDVPPAAMAMASVLLVTATVSPAFLGQTVIKVSAQISSRVMGNAAVLCPGHIPFLPALLSPPLPFFFICFQGSMGKGHFIPELPERTDGSILKNTYVGFTKGRPFLCCSVYYDKHVFV